MKYVGYGALVATFWLLVATVRVIVHDDCVHEATVVSAPMPAAVSASPAVVREARRATDQLPAVTMPDYPRDRYRPQECRVPIDDCLLCMQPAGGPMSKSALVAGLNAVRPCVAACYQQFQVPGVAMVNVVIAKSGRVAKAEVTGKFAHTPTGACVEQAVKAARFPQSDGFSTPYPFQLK